MNQNTAKQEAEKIRCQYELMVEEYFGVKLSSKPSPVNVNDHTLADFALFVSEHKSMVIRVCDKCGVFVFNKDGSACVNGHPVK